MSIEEQATGCRGAHEYKEYAQNNGYTIVKVLDWTSSAGDWIFGISKDGKIWDVLYQTNSYPKAGFSYQIEKLEFEGDFEDLCYYFSVNAN